VDARARTDQARQFLGSKCKTPGMFCFVVLLRNHHVKTDFILYVEVYYSEGRIVLVCSSHLCRLLLCAVNYEPPPRQTMRTLVTSY
jgi:hypothetical protein